jgi:hypothetical protein
MVLPPPDIVEGKLHFGVNGESVHRSFVASLPVGPCLSMMRSLQPWRMNSFRLGLSEWLIFTPLTGLNVDW